MKVYSRPEVLEDHIAPALIMATPDVGIFLGDNIQNGEFQGNNGPIITPITGDPIVFEVFVPKPDPISTPVDFSAFKIRTVKIGSDGSLFSGSQPEIDLQSALFQTLLGKVSFSSPVTQSTISLLADELSSNHSVIEAIDSAVGEDRSAALVGLSSEEFERSGGAAFLTSL
jgi:hypothetical protein